MIQRTAELARILALPRRVWTDNHAAQMAERLTAALKTPEGAMSLRPIQAIALAELKARDGLLASIRVGGGKTLLSLLAPTILGSQRPLILVPAKLRDKTQREMLVLRRHWRISPVLRVESYEMVGRMQHAELLERWDPDFIGCDEAHRVRNPKAAVTRRLLRLLARQRCKLLAMSGTITRRSLRDYAHLLILCLGKEHAPVPTNWSEVEEWAAVLDQNRDKDMSIEVGALRVLCEGEVGDDLVTRARLGFRRRFVETRGVVATTEAPDGDASLTIARVCPPIPPPVRAALRALRADWELPDGQKCVDGIAVWRHARELALGFYYMWDPAPPEPWMEARKDWCGECRYILGHNQRNLDSELQVIHAVDAGLYPHAEPVLEAWRAIRDTFRPNPVPVWLSKDVARWVVDRVKSEPTIVWTEHRAFAAALEELGLPYYGKKGQNARTGRVIEDADPHTSLCASIKSNGEGRNLQAWSRALVASPPSSGDVWEQLLGREHRPGQEADEVVYERLVTCDEHDQAFDQALELARYIQDSTGLAQKMLYADLT